MQLLTRYYVVRKEKLNLDQENNLYAEANVKLIENFKVMPHLDCVYAFRAVIFPIELQLNDIRRFKNPEALASFEHLSSPVLWDELFFMSNTENPTIDVQSRLKVYIPFAESAKWSLF